MSVGYPDEPGHYDKFEDSGITVYVQSGVSCPTGSITISVGQFLWMERLVVEGMV